MTSSLASSRATIVDTVFRRLFENEFATLDGIAISRRGDEGVEYIDEAVALGRMLDIEGAFEPSAVADEGIERIHQRIYATSVDYTAVVSGWSRHLKALLDEGMALPSCTSMMRKRGITDLAPHLVDRSTLESDALDATIAAAHATKRRNEATHLLVVARDGYVVAAGATPIIAMANWHNVEFAARVECMRAEEAATQRG